MIVPMQIGLEWKITRENHRISNEHGNEAVPNLLWRKQKNRMKQEA